MQNGRWFPRFGISTRRIVGLGLLGLIELGPTIASAQAYPEAGIANLRATCTQRPDIPPQAMPAYCDCYVEQIQKVVPWHDFLLVDSAIRVKGLGNLDAEEKDIMMKALEVTFYCSQKVTR
jgi:hypothetical protein